MAQADGFRFMSLAAGRVDGVRYCDMHLPVRRVALCVLRIEPPAASRPFGFHR